MTLRVSLVQDLPGTPSQRALREAFARRFELSFFPVGPTAPTSIAQLGEHRDFDAVIWHVDDRILWTAPAFDWRSYEGARIQYEEDAYQDFSPLAGTRFRKRAAPLFRSMGFHTLVSTGKLTTERLREQGVHAVWIPKGYDATRIEDEGASTRAGLCSYGSGYPARVAMLDHVARAGIAVERVRCTPDELGRVLNRYVGCLICNMELRGARLLPGRLLRRLPLALRQGAPGIETMIKNFEAAGAGCAPICDALDELVDLGFTDGTTMVSYDSFAELIEKLRHYEDAHDELRAIGHRAGELARARHTWDHRAIAFEQLVTSGSYLPES